MRDGVETGKTTGRRKISWDNSSNPRPYLGKLVVVYQQWAVYSTDQLYVLVPSTHRTIHRDMTCTVLKAT